MNSSERESTNDDFWRAYLLKGARMRPPGRRWRGQCFRFRTRTPYADGDEVHNRRKHFSWNTSPRKDSSEFQTGESSLLTGHYFFCLGCCMKRWELSRAGPWWQSWAGRISTKTKASTDFTHNMVRHSRASASAKQRRMMRQSASERDDDITFVVVVGSGLEWFQIFGSDESTPKENLRKSTLRMLISMILEHLLLKLVWY